MGELLTRSVKIDSRMLNVKSELMENGEIIFYLAALLMSADAMGTASMSLAGFRRICGGSAKNWRKQDTDHILSMLGKLNALSDKLVYSFVLVDLSVGTKGAVINASAYDREDELLTGRPAYTELDGAEWRTLINIGHENRHSPISLFLVYMYIKSFTRVWIYNGSRYRGCWLSRNLIGENLNMGEKKVKTAIETLISAGLVTYANGDKNRGVGEYIIGRASCEEMEDLYQKHLQHTQSVAKRKKGSLS